MSKPERQWNRAAVIGSGMMGPGIALTLAMGGVEATIVSRTEDGARRAEHKALMLAAELAENGLLGDTAPVAATDDADAAIAAADIVVESVPESLPLKQEMFAHWDRIARPDAVLASNTSALSITAIAERCSRPERVLTTHFWNPPHLMRLVEVVKGERTSPEVVDAVRALLERCGKVPVVIQKDTPGQLGNRLQFALLREAIHIVEQGIATVEDVDKAVKNGLGVRMPVYGPFEHQDVVGLGTCKAVMDYVAPSLSNASQSPALLEACLAGGRGFYEPGVLDHDEARARRDRWVLEFMKRRPAGKARG